MVFAIAHKVIKPIVRGQQAYIYSVNERYACVCLCMLHISICDYSSFTVGEKIKWHGISQTDINIFVFVIVENIYSMRNLLKLQFIYRLVFFSQKSWVLNWYKSIFACIHALRRKCLYIRIPRVFHSTINIYCLTNLVYFITSSALEVLVFLLLLFQFQTWFVWNLTVLPSNCLAHFLDNDE